jgi:PAS domain S-box-containing protein
MNNAKTQTDSEHNASGFAIGDMLGGHQHIFHTVLQAVPSGLSLVSAEGRITYWNPAAESLTGLAPAQVIGQTCNAIFNCPNYDQLCPLAQSLRGHARPEPTTALCAEATLAVNGRTIHLQKTSNYIQDAQHRFLGAIESFVDVTREHETRAALHEARELVESARKAKRHFMANMSHEIRTPLNAIWGLLDLLLADDAVTPSQQDMLTSARRSAELLVDLVGDILDFTIIDKGALRLEYTGFSLRSIIASVIARQYELTQNKAVSIHSQVDDDVPDNLLGDSGRLYQILKHLVGNGIKFTPAGEVAVRVSRAPAAESDGAGAYREIELHFSIHDTGVGIPKEQLAHIFESLSQVDESSTRAFGGLGIGLHIVQRLVVMLDGRIWIESTPGQGTIVDFVLPFGSAANGDAVGPVPGLPASPTAVDESDETPAWSLNPGVPKMEAAPWAPEEKTMKILIAEDEPISRRIIEKNLSRLGRCDTVVDGAEAVEAFKLAAEDGTPYDLICLDIMMPGVDGQAALKQIREIERQMGIRGPWEVKVIMLTALDDPHSVVEAYYRGGATSYLVKPIEVEKLRFELRRLGLITVEETKPMAK